jgi:hypothetical protein
LIFLRVLLNAQEGDPRLPLRITSNSHTNEAEACPFWVLPQVNDANETPFVHSVYSPAMTFRKPYRRRPSTNSFGSSQEAGCPAVPQNEAFVPVDDKSQTRQGLQ